MNNSASIWKVSEPARNRFGKRLQELREERGFTRLELATYAGLFIASCISDMERGVEEEQPTISTLDRLATVFSLTLSEFLDGV